MTMDTNKEQCALVVFSTYPGSFQGCHVMSLSGVDEKQGIRKSATYFKAIMISLLDPCALLAGK